MRVQDSILTTKSISGQIVVKQVDTGGKEFLRTIRANIRAFWSGTWDFADFIIAMQSAIDFSYHRAWSEGASECGIFLSEMSAAERAWLNRRIATDQLFVDNLATDLDARSRAQGGKLYSFYPRANLWANNYNAVKNQARLMSCGDQKYRWVITATESCLSCLKLAGKIKRASYWRDQDVHPQHRGKLECMLGAGGVPVCKCYFERTSEPVTPGALPRLP